ncbi:MAG TPA: PDZ domain-containing protein [Dehalococcoidia bacterium]|jgi:S1-C subfamily serine protease|nr:PDZ domain-containing protein [Dehalococcoidia bacterium]|tara:strand:- start:5860 stop:7113 length:1254 start_codon:yes stop_codon:yes gene_type:complete
MYGVSKAFALAITSLSAAVILVVIFAWQGPGFNSVTPSASAALFDEQLVQGIYEQASPAVVDINVDRRLEDSFNRLGFGSGFLVDSEGHIVTNNHVIQGADRIRISFKDGTSAEAETLGTNPANDLALLKVSADAVKNIKPLTLGDSGDAKPGQLAIAIGSPFGLGGSITVGVISGVDRTLNSDLSRPISGVLQTDALINPGNSGGPLLDRQGKVVGINTAIQVSLSDFNPRNLGRGSIGFAVPVNTLVNLLPRLKENQVIRPPWLGITAASLEPLLVEALDLTVDHGVYVTQVMSGSPANKVGLVAAGLSDRGRPPKGGDVIVAVDGTKVRSVASLIALLNLHLPGDEVTLSLVRDGENLEVALNLGEWPADRELQPRSRNFPQPRPEEFTQPKNPLVPSTPGFEFPDLFPKKRSR